MIIDGLNANLFLEEWQALYLILELDLIFDPTTNSSDFNFSYRNKLRNLIIRIIYKNGNWNLRINGSIGKYIRGDNRSDSNWEELDTAIKNIKNDLRLNVAIINKGKITEAVQPLFLLSKVEVGVNIEVGIDDIDRFLNLNLIQHKSKPFIIIDDLVYTCRHEDFILKLYPKGLNILRIEIAFLARELRKYKIKTIDDLTPSKIKPMAERLLKEFKEIIFSDGVNFHMTDGLSKKEELAILRYTNNTRNKHYKDNIKLMPDAVAKKHKQRMWRLKTKVKNILEDKKAGYRDILIQSLTEKIKQYYPCDR